ncbi:MAG TPA: hypothetical protein VKR83_13325 [Ktedonobacteraceae bacterium]|nr:hypothetical protein [Ktedonobacteraceae bacterium]
MKAAILTMATTRTYDNHADALFVLDKQEEAKVLEAIQQQQLSDDGILVIIEGYASLQSLGTDQKILISDIIRSRASGNHPNTELLSREVTYFSGRGIFGLRVVFTTSPLKRIVYDIVNGDIQESHV